ncbi:MAG: aminodeoxychorismate synthase component I [Timaviella obliquedivisa GSE-PSE-MK23-08B]|jgi:para-aminobenzoate synthetase/4-amino-4-deoxychorismate lyase|nr:aminodeoxychorismate synthase component I [Timaviella obliquedivisa GSE-PSE-MK23-08B]
MASTAPTVIIHDVQSQTWLDFHDPVTILVAHTPDQVLSLLETLQQQIDQHHLYAAGFLSYEASLAFDPAFTVKPTLFPLAWFGLYSKPEVINLPPLSLSQPLNWIPDITRAQYDEAFNQVKHYICQGLTYQVNLSFRLNAQFPQSPWHYFNQLAQNAQYGAFIETPDWAICCASPELFFRQNHHEIHCRPMKGTVPRGLTHKGDRLLAQWLQNSKKNQAENIMIVDMIRNDLGRIAQVGTVKVNSLFNIEQYPTLWQMTSSVQCHTQTTLSEIFQALFPCASITGAPKRQTMKIIAELENTPRKIYTGTIGFITPDRTSQFNVAIRTVLINKNDQTAEYGVGGGIVWDSQAGEEFEECRTKAKILTAQPPEFSLLETLLWTPEKDYFLLNLHLERLIASAEYFAFPTDQSTVQNYLKAIALTFPPHPQKVRLLLSSQGTLTHESSLLVQTHTPLRVCLAPSPVKSSHVFLYHKTSDRQIYAQAQQQCPGYDDVILWNENGELTEFCTGNLVVELDGQWYTPPIECGLLPGTYRAWLLEQGMIQERIIRVKELANCAHVFLVNSVRQKREAIIDPPFSI